MDTTSSSESAVPPSSPSSVVTRGFSTLESNTSAAEGNDDDSTKFKEDEEAVKEETETEVEDEKTTPTDTQMLTIADATLEKVPPHLENLLSSFDVHQSIPADHLLIVLIYGIALECSFASVEEVQRNLRCLKRMSYLSTYHVKNARLLSKMPEKIYDPSKMIYTIRLQLIFDEDATPCVLTGIVTGDFLILTLTPDCGDAGGKSICLSIGRYVLNSKGRPFPSRFRKLPELSYKLREEVLIPIHNYMIKREGRVILYPGLEGLPEELYPYLYVHMNENCLNKMANVSKRLRNTVKYYKKFMLKK